MDTAHPPAIDLTRLQVIGADEVAKLYNFSLDHFRRLYRSGKVPRPMKVGERKLGWQRGQILDDLAHRAELARAA